MTSHPAVVSRRDFLRLGATAAALGPGPSGRPTRTTRRPTCSSATPSSAPTCPAGATSTSATMRAVVVKADGTGRRVLAEELTREKGSWTQFVGWSPDGKAAMLSRNWKSEENGKWEEEHKTFRFRRRLLADAYLVDLASGKATNVTASSASATSTSLGSCPATRPGSASGDDRRQIAPPWTSTARTRAS